MNRKRRTQVVAIGAILMFFTGAFVSDHERKLLLYNRTPSIPIGWYVYAGRLPKVGDLVAFKLPVAAQAYARARGESPHVRLLKPVLAVAGDRVSTMHAELHINGVSFGPIPATDAAGHTLPRWQADHVLVGDELIVGSTAPHSFDSRFFGPVHATDVQGVYRPLSVDSAANTPAESTSSVRACRKFPPVAMTRWLSQR